MANTIQKLTEAFARFPGIGPRQAKRFVYHLLLQDQDKIGYLTYLLGELKKEVRICRSCFRFHSERTQDLCDICRDPARDSTMLMVIAHDNDLDTVERSGSYEGFYFVLGGLTPLFGKNDADIRVPELIQKIEKMKTGGLREVIFALAANTEGDYTAQILTQKLEPHTKDAGIKISLLGRGLSTGTELEYSDSDTIRNALKNRT